jgi:hypothetical protein
VSQPARPARAVIESGVPDAIFSMLEAVPLRPAPHPKFQRLVALGVVLQGTLPFRRLVQGTFDVSGVSAPVTETGFDWLPLWVACPL